jgi:hypothetical protein
VLQQLFPKFAQLEKISGMGLVFKVVLVYFTANFAGQDAKNEVISTSCVCGSPYL